MKKLIWMLKVSAQIHEISDLWWKKRFQNLLERLNSISHPLAHLYIYIYIDNFMSRFQKNTIFQKLMSRFQKNVNISTNWCQYFKKNSIFQQIYVNISKTFEYFNKLGAGHSMEEPGGHLGAWRPSPIYIYIY